VQFVVEATSVADRIPVRVSSPKRCLGRVAVGTVRTSATCSGQSLFRLDEWSVVSVHLVVQAASVAEVVAGAVASPEWR